jgi:hypothetical protein
MSDLTLTEFDPLLKDHYVKEKVRNLAFGRNTFYALIPKNTKGRGRKIVQPIDYRRPTNGGALFTVAKANAKPSGYEAFELTRVKTYHFPTVDNETIEATADDEAAFMPAFEEFDRAFKTVGDRVGRQVFRTRGGYIGRIATDAAFPVAGAVAKLIDPADAFAFDEGQRVILGVTNGTSGAPKAGVLVVAGIDYEAGLITFTGNITAGVATAAQGDYMFAEADFASGSVSQCIAGLQDWLPGNETSAFTERDAALAATFFGVIRSAAKEKLGGVFRDARGENLVETIIKGGATVAKHGGSPDTGLANPEVFSDLMLLLESRKVRMENTETTIAGIGYKGVRATVGEHDIKFYSDRSNPSKFLYLLQLNTWRLHSAGETPRFLDRDGLLKRSETADAYEARVGGYHQMGCSAPGWNFVGQLRT